MIVLTSVTTVFFFLSLLSQYFWKKQFDIICIQCDVFRAAFSDSRIVFVESSYPYFQE